MTPPEIEAISSTGGGADTSGLSGIQSRVLNGDPNKASLYTIQLAIPPNTRIEAHTHPDDRAATVVSGNWYIGYGSRFDEKNVKVLAPGSFYTEPPNVAHFARTGDRSDNRFWTDWNSIHRIRSNKMIKRISGSFIIILSSFRDHSIATEQQI